MCPPRWTTADFLTSVTDPHEHHVRAGWEDRIPRSAQDFEAAFRASEYAAWNLDDIAAFEASIEDRPEDERGRNYNISFVQQVLACTDRQFRVMRGDRVVLAARWLGVSLQGMIIGSLFFKLPANALGVYPKGGVMFFNLLFNTLLALAELAGAFESRPILMKHKSFSFYRQRPLRMWR